MELEVPPTLIIVDSVQTMRTLNCPSSIGSVSQIRESAAKFVSFAKSTGNDRFYDFLIYFFSLLFCVVMLLKYRRNKNFSKYI